MVIQIQRNFNNASQPHFYFYILVGGKSMMIYFPENALPRHRKYNIILKDMRNHRIVSNMDKLICHSICVLSSKWKQLFSLRIRISGKMQTGERWRRWSEAEEEARWGRGRVEVGVAILYVPMTISLRRQLYKATWWISDADMGVNMLVPF